MVFSGDDGDIGEDRVDSRISQWTMATSDDRVDQWATTAWTCSPELSSRDWGPLGVRSVARSAVPCLASLCLSRLVRAPPLSEALTLQTTSADCEKATGNSWPQPRSLIPAPRVQPRCATGHSLRLPLGSNHARGFMGVADFVERQEHRIRAYRLPTPHPHPRQALEVGTYQGARGRADTAEKWPAVGTGAGGITRRILLGRRDGASR
jgi:hypothetical protein